MSKSSEVGATDVSWDVHIGYLSPRQWDGLPTERARRVIGGQPERPGITSETIDWASLNLIPRWVGEDSASAVAAIQPSVYADRGLADWERFIAGTRVRGELALAISMIGGPGDPMPVQIGGPSAWIALPVPFPDAAHVGGPRIPLAKPPTIAEGLTSVDRDLASLLIEAHDPESPWWSLELTGVQRMRGDGSDSGWIDPLGTLSPLLISAAGEVVAAVWTSPDGAVRHYIIPSMPDWTPVLKWLSQRAIVELALSAPAPKANADDRPAEPAPATPAAAEAADPESPSTGDTTAAAKPRQSARTTTLRQAGRIGTKARELPRTAWDAVKKHPVFAPTAAGVLVLIIWAAITFVWARIYDSNSHQPQSSNATTTPTSTNPPIPTSTTAATTTSPPPTSPPLPPRPSEEHEIPVGSTGEFFQRAVTIGISSAYSSYSFMTITTAKMSCTERSLQVGEAVEIAGKNADRDDYFRITLLKSTRDVSATLRVEEMPAADWPDRVPLCPA